MQVRHHLSQESCRHFALEEKGPPKRGPFPKKVVGISHLKKRVLQKEAQESINCGNFESLSLFL